MDCPASPAPAAGNPEDSQVFGQQLRDAHDSLRSHPVGPATGSISGPKRAAARGSEKKSPRDGEARRSVSTQVNAPPPSVLPLHLAVPNAGAEGVGPDGASAAGFGLSEAADPVQPDAAPEGQAGAPGTQALSGELSFALKLDPRSNPDTGNSDQKGAQTPQNPLAPRLEAQINGNAAGVKEERHGDAGQDAPSPAPRIDAMARLVAFQATEKTVPADSQPPAQPPADAAKALETSAVQTPAVDSAAKPAGPLKELSIQIGQMQNDKVELRVVERSGELQVAVRAANPDLAQGLRQGLPDLVDRLEQNGFRAEAWRPGATTTTVQGAGETRQRPMQFQHDQSQPQSQSGGQQQGRQQNRPNQSYRPQWVRELEGNLSGGSFPGEINGLAS
jgi:hypothetical protein